MKKLESGRSMVEMLGVLAIIGVLSVGGIAGYVLSMNRYRANQMLDLANKYAGVLSASQQAYVIRNGSMANWTAPTFAQSKVGTLPGNGYSISLDSSQTFSDAETRFTLNLTFISESICKTAVKINADPNVSCNGTQASFVFNVGN